jgi:hypothetical protein
VARAVLSTPGEVPLVRLRESEVARAFAVRGVLIRFVRLGDIRVGVRVRPTWTGGRVRERIGMSVEKGVRNLHMEGATCFERSTLHVVASLHRKQR